MPDLTPALFFRCTQRDRVTLEALSSDGKTSYLANVASCTCPGFKFRGDCKHVRQLCEDTCDWNSLYSEEPTDTKGNTARCPRCGSPAIAYTEYV